MAPAGLWHLPAWERLNVRLGCDRRGDAARALRRPCGGKQARGALFSDPANPTHVGKPVVDADHGRIETRVASVPTNIAWLIETHDWPGLKAVGKVERTREIDGKSTSETALLSAPLSPERLNEVARSH